jgi:hypothetical protein
MMSSSRVLLAVIALTGVAALSCSSPAVGDKIDLDADSASDLAERDGVHIPDGFEFVDGRTHVEFVGKAAWTARYTGPGIYADGVAVSAANPSFPPMQATDCSAAPAISSEPCSPGFVTTLPPAGGADSVTIQLGHNRDETQLIVSGVGH